MQTLGLDSADYAAYVAALRSTHRRRIVLEIQTLDGDPVVEIEPRQILSGAVHVDALGDVTRILEVEFLDPSRSVIFEQESAAGVPIHRSRMVKVHDLRFVVALDRWVDCEVFTGVIHDYDREGPVVRIVGHGKEAQSQGARWTPRTWQPKTRKWRIIRSLLEDEGETQMRIPRLNATTPRRFTVMRLDVPWFKAKRLARSMGRQLFYDGRGVAVLRRVPERAVFRFGPEMLTSPVRLARPEAGIKNTFVVVGGRPRGSKRQVTGKAFLPASNPLSAYSLRRNGSRLRLVERVQDDQFKTSKDCKREALSMRDESLRAQFEVTVDGVLPVPHLDERDLVRISDGAVSVLIRLITWDLPLTGEAMSLGSIKRAGSVGGLYRTIRRTEGVA